MENIGAEMYSKERAGERYNSGGNAKLEYTPSRPYLGLHLILKLVEWGTPFCEEIEVQGTGGQLTHGLWDNVETGKATDSLNLRNYTSILSCWVDLVPGYWSVRQRAAMPEVVLVDTMCIQGCLCLAVPPGCCLSSCLQNHLDHRSPASSHHSSQYSSYWAQLGLPGEQCCVISTLKCYI